MEAIWRAGCGRLSNQVLHEYYVTVTRKLDPGMPIVLARADVRDLRSWRPVMPSLDLTEEAWATGRVPTPRWPEPAVDPFRDVG